MMYSIAPTSYRQSKAISFAQQPKRAMGSFSQASPTETASPDVYFGRRRATAALLLLALTGGSTASCGDTVDCTDPPGLANPPIGCGGVIYPSDSASDSGAEAPDADPPEEAPPNNGPAPITPGATLPVPPPAETTPTQPPPGTSTTIAEGAVQWALEQVGKTVETDRDHIIDNYAYGEEALLAPGEGWCASFATIAFNKAAERMGKERGAPWYPQASYVRQIREWAEENNRFIGRDGQPQRGDLILFGNDRHVGLVVEVKADGTIVTVEGNTSRELEDGTRDNTQIGVWTHTYDNAYDSDIYGFVRPGV